MILFDTNVLVYVHNKASPNHQKAYQLESEVLNGKIPAAISVQNLLEFYATITNSLRVTKPLKPQEAKEVISDYLKSPFQIIHPKPSDIEKTIEIATKRNISGARIFDIQLVVTMITDGIDTIYTGNEKHFKMFNEIKVVNPFK